MRFEPGNKFGKGRPPIGQGRTADLKGAQRKLQQILDIELAKPVMGVSGTGEFEGTTKGEKIVFELIQQALAGKVQAIDIILERWAGKPAIVQLEKAYAEDVKVTVENVGSRPKSEFDIADTADPFSTKTN